VPIERRDGFRLWVGGPVPKGSDGITLGPLIIVRSGCESSSYLIRHEHVHVRQWKRYGIVGFSARYLGSYAKGRLLRRGHKGAYRRIPFEIEADWIARRSISTAVRDQATESVDAR
jgi:hypothetical protein